MSDPDVAETAKKNGTTRAVASMEKAAKLDKPLIFAIGNAPTALIQLYEMIREGRIRPELIIGVPVGFVNVVQAKELIMTADVPYIVAKGRKGGSNIAAAICNALLYMLDSSREVSTELENPLPQTCACAGIELQINHKGSLLAALFLRENCHA